MARIRTIKPEFWDDEKLSTLPYGCRLLFIGMWNFSDDAGFIRSTEKFIKAKIFPYDDDLRISEIKKWIDALTVSNMVIPISHSGESYLIVRNFDKHQKVDTRYNNYYIKDEAIRNQLLVKAKNPHTTYTPLKHDLGSTPTPLEMEGNVSVNGSGCVESPPMISDIEVYKTECLNDEMYFIAPLCQQFGNYGLTKTNFPLYLLEFNTHLNSLTDTIKSRKDYRGHFKNWIPKRLKEPSMQSPASAKSDFDKAFEAAKKQTP